MKWLFSILCILLVVSCVPEALEQQVEPEEPELVPPQLVESSLPSRHIIKITNTGFEPDLIIIKTGDTVVWENIRTGKINTALVAGTRQCVAIKSKLLKPGETFEKVFDEVNTCQFVEGVTNTHLVKVFIED